MLIIYNQNKVNNICNPGKDMRIGRSLELWEKPVVKARDLGSNSTFALC